MALSSCASTRSYRTGPREAPSKKQLENQRDVVKLLGAALRLADQVFVSTCRDIAPDLTERRSATTPFRSLKNQDAETLVSYGPSAKLSTSDKN